MKGLAFVVLACGISMFVGPNPAAAQQPIIDVHMHGGYRTGRFVVTADGTPLARPCRPTPCDRIPAQLSSPDEIIPRTLEEMKRHNIVLGVLSDAPPVPKDERWVFDDWSASDPKRFIFGYSIWHPNDIALDDLRRLLESGAIQVIGELGFQYSEIAIDDPILEPIFALADEFDVPVFVHLGSNGRGATFPMHLGNPLDLGKVMRKHPSLRVCVENASFPFLEGIVAVMMRSPNVYADISTLTWTRPRTVIHKYLRELVEYGLSKRIMFGSDQMMWPEVIGTAIETIESADFLTAEQKRDIFYNNAARFLRLTEEEIDRHHGR